MRGVLSCLLAAGAVSLVVLTPDPGTAAEGGFRRPGHSFGQHNLRRGFGHHSFRRGFGEHNFRRGFGHHGFTHNGFNRHGFGHDRKNFGHRGFRHDGFKNGFLPYSYLTGNSYPSSVTIVQQGDAYPVTTGTIPSVADLPAVTGIASQPSAEPAIYVVNGARRDMPAPARRSERPGAKILTVDPSDAPSVPADVSSGGARIIHLDVPVGR
ncbi:MAG TPA: hypothetical protein VH743_16445 [Beijerinckiaceae bacterium]|jgi:hypothetical protein